MSKPNDTCGCSWDEDSYTETRCREHWIPLDMSSWGVGHQYSCQECCDLGWWMKAVQEYSLEELRHAIRHLRRKQQPYAKYLLRLLEEDE